MYFICYVNRPLRNNKRVLVYVCVYVCVYVYLCVSVFVRVCGWVGVRACVRECVRIQVWTHVSKYEHDHGKYTNMRTCIYMYVFQVYMRSEGAGGGGAASLSTATDIDTKGKNTTLERRFRKWTSTAEKSHTHKSFFFSSFFLFFPSQFFNVTISVTITCFQYFPTGGNYRVH